MKKTLFMISLVGCAFAAQGSIQYFDSGTLDAAVPDANPVGLAFHETVAGFAPAAPVVSIQVTLNLSGGWNGDLYAYLSHGGQQAVLLNRVGAHTPGVSSFGYGDSGMSVNFVMADAANQGNIHTYGGGFTPSGNYLADGAAIDKGLDVFKANNIVANGDWTLFVADLSGGGNSTLTSWSMQVQAIPEPMQMALGIFGGLFGLAALWRSPWVARRFKRSEGR